MILGHTRTFVRPVISGTVARLKAGDRLELVSGSRPGSVVGDYMLLQELDEYDGPPNGIEALVRIVYKSRNWCDEYLTGIELVPDSLLEDARANLWVSPEQLLAELRRQGAER